MWKKSDTWKKFYLFRFLCSREVVDDEFEKLKPSPFAQTKSIFHSFCTSAFVYSSEMILYHFDLLSVFICTNRFGNDFLANSFEWTLFPVRQANTPDTFVQIE